MGKYPDKNPKHTDDFTVVSPVVPEINTPEDVENMSTAFAMYAGMNTKKLAVLMAIGQDLVSDSPRSDAQIAKDLGIQPHTVGRYRNDPQWSMALGTLVVGIARGRSDLYLQWTEKSAKEGKVSAQKLLWEISGIYIQRKKSMNMNIDMTLDTGNVPKTYTDAVDDFLIALGEAGWNAQQIVERFNALRASGAW